MALVAASFCTLSRFWLEIAIYSSTEIVLKGIYGVIVLSLFVSHGHRVTPVVGKLKLTSVTSSK